MLRIIVRTAAAFALGAALVMGGGERLEAAPITYEGTLTPGVTVSGTVSASGFINEDAAGTDFWRFFGTAGDVVTIRGDRTNDQLDLAFSLYFGETTADESEFLVFVDWGGLTFLAFADDEIPHPGPWGDPLLENFLLPSTGVYTIAIGGFASGASTAPYTYDLVMTGATPVAVPAPGALALIGVGLLGLGLVRRRRPTADATSLH
jgi:hypothetical protein